MEEVLFQDHAVIFEKNDGTRVFVTQPYATKKEIEESEELKNWLVERGLEVVLVSEELSWHYPSKTVFAYEAEKKHSDRAVIDQKKALVHWYE